MAYIQNILSRQTEYYLLQWKQHSDVSDTITASLILHKWQNNEAIVL